MKEILLPKQENPLKCCVRSRTGEQGQSLLEFALVVPVLFLMLIGVAFIAQGVNLQMVLYGAAYEGARMWAKNPPGGDASHCTPPACDPNDTNAMNFEKYVVPAVRQYISNNGFDGANAYFYTDKPEKYREILQLYVNQTQFVRIIVLYPINLPIGNFASGYQRLLISASCTFRRGT